MIYWLDYSTMYVECVRIWMVGGSNGRPIMLLALIGWWLIEWPPNLIVCLELLMVEFNGWSGEWRPNRYAYIVIARAIHDSVHHELQRWSLKNIPFPKEETLLNGRWRNFSLDITLMERLIGGTTAQSSCYWVVDGGIDCWLIEMTARSNGLHWIVDKGINWFVLCF